MNHSLITDGTSRVGCTADGVAEWGRFCWAGVLGSPDWGSCPTSVKVDSPVRSTFSPSEKELALATKKNNNQLFFSFLFRPITPVEMIVYLSLANHT